MKAFASKRQRDPPLEADDEWALALATEPAGGASALQHDIIPLAHTAVPPAADSEPDENDDGNVDGAADDATRKRAASAAAWGALLAARGSAGAHGINRPPAPAKPRAAPASGVQLQLAPVRADGVAVGAHRLCAQCGFLYTRGCAEDARAHARQHSASASPTPLIRPLAGEHVVETGSTADGEHWRVVRVDVPTAPPAAAAPHAQRVARLSELLERELGCDALIAPRSAPLVAFALVGRAHRLRGVVVAEPIPDGEGWEIHVPAQDDRGGGGEAGAASSAPAAAAAARDGSLRCSAVRTPAECGVRYVWVDPSRRRAGIARALVEVVRAHLLPGVCVPRERVAFSQPTADGHAFARRYAGTPHFAVYIPP
jgi:N-acetyltransferase